VTKPKLPTAAEINAANAEFWNAESAWFEEFAREHPAEMQNAAIVADALIKAGHINDAKVAHKTNLNSAMRLAQLQQHGRAFLEQNKNQGKKNRERGQKTLSEVRSQLERLRAARPDATQEQAAAEIAPKVWIRRKGINCNPSVDHVIKLIKQLEPGKPRRVT
jgi:hypothetical protein